MDPHKIRRAIGTGFVRTDTLVACTLTRFRLRSPLHLPSFYLAYRRVQRAAKTKVPGLIVSAFFIERPSVCCTLGLWQSDQSISDFNELFEHIHAANWAIRRVYDNRQKVARLTSLHMRVEAFSQNLYWDDVDLRPYAGVSDEW